MSSSQASISPCNGPNAHPERRLSRSEPFVAAGLVGGASTGNPPSSRSLTTEGGDGELGQGQGAARQRDLGVAAGAD